MEYDDYPCSRPYGTIFLKIIGPTDKSWAKIIAYLRYIHYVFSTKNRKPLIRLDFEHRLWAYLGGIARTHEMKALAVGGVANHIHALILISPVLSVATAAQLLKGGSSRWLNDHFFTNRSFRWQRGWGAFSVSESNVLRVIRCVENQKKHHSRKTFQEAYKIEYEERYVFQ